MKVQINQDDQLKYIKCFYWIYWLPILGAWWHKRFLKNLNYEFSEDYFIQECGVFFHRKKRVPLKGIREATIHRGPICQLLNLSIVTAHTSGQNVGVPELYILCPEDPEGLIEKLTEYGEK